MEGGVVKIEGGVVKKCKSVVKTLKTVVKNKQFIVGSDQQDPASPLKGVPDSSGATRTIVVTFSSRWLNLQLPKVAAALNQNV